MPTTRRGFLGWLGAFFPAAYLAAQDKKAAAYKDTVARIVDESMRVDAGVPMPTTIPVSKELFSTNDAADVELASAARESISGALDSLMQPHVTSFDRRGDAVRWIHGAPVSGEYWNQLNDDERAGLSRYLLEVQEKARAHREYEALCKRSVRENFHVDHGDHGHHDCHTDAYHGDHGDSHADIAHGDTP
jgi:hypothetical protein